MLDGEEMSGADHAQSGPEVVDELLQQLARLTEEDTLYLAELWAEEDQDARRRAWQRARSAVEREGFSGELDRVRNELSQWMLTGPADYQGLSGLLGLGGDHTVVRRRAAPAVLDAAVALLAQRDLHSTDYDVLAGPWRRLLAEPQADRSVARELELD